MRATNYKREHEMCLVEIIYAVAPMTIRVHSINIGFVYN